MRAHYYQPQWIAASNAELSADVCIYGGTPAGIVAAVAAVRRGRSVLVLQPGGFLGGMTTGGLGETDSGKEAVIGGLARQFYRDLGKMYGLPECWKFEPSAAGEVFAGDIAEHGIPVEYNAYLQDVRLDNGRIAAIRLLGGRVVRAKMFVDATYEGDLLAQAGVPWTAGRESNSTHGETINGVQVREKHQFSHPVDPYVVAGDPSSGVLPGIQETDCAPAGSGDHRIQAYTFRVCMTNDPDLLVPWPKPWDYDPLAHELARRWFQGGKDGFNELLRDGDMFPQKFGVICRRRPNGDRVKTDTNNHGPVSSDFIGASWGWPEAGYTEREKIFQRHVTYQQGFYWTMAHDPGIPAKYREVFRTFGLAGDEFPETGHWPHQLYVREARRMKSDYVLSESDTRHLRQAEDPVGMGSYQMDSHNCQRIIREGRVLNEGDVQLRPAAPYRISYRSIVPGRGQVANLFVPVCLSASHIAFGSVRMEPVFMILGESAGIAASMAIEAGCAVQDVPYTELGPELLAAGQVLGAG